MSSQKENPAAEIDLTTQQVSERIVVVREAQVILDSEIAQLYGVETKMLNRAVKRNAQRFPEHFRFQLTEEEWERLRFQSSTSKIDDSLRFQSGTLEKEATLRSQSATLKQSGRGQHRKYLPYVFTEQGIFYNGQIFDAYTFASDLIRQAQKSLCLIDNYVDDAVLALMSKREPKVAATIYTRKVSKAFQLDLDKHNAQYSAIAVKTLLGFHDRFLLVDGKKLYHLGASLKDLGKQCFAFSRMDDFAEELLDKLK